MSRINDYLMKLEEEDKASDDPHRVLTKDSLMPTEEERNDYKDSFTYSTVYINYDGYLWLVTGYSKNDPRLLPSI